MKDLVIISKMLKLFGHLKNYIIRREKNRRYANFTRSVNKLTVNKVHSPVILYGPCFSIYEPCKVHDFILSQALKLRGAKIIPCTMGRLQFGETSFLGGIWGGFVDGEDKINSKASEANYKFVANSDNQLWERWSNLKPETLDKYISKQKIEELKILAHSYPFSEYHSWEYGDLPVGKWAVNTLRNNSTSSDETLVLDYREKLYNYLHHILVMVEACNSILDVIKPEIVITNDSYYYPWAILEKLCIIKSIPFYNCYPNIRKNAICYAKDEPAMALNITNIWEKYKKIDLSSIEAEKLHDFFSTRTEGKYSPGLNTCSPQENSDYLEKFNWNGIDKSKPTALMTPNVCWDLVALNKDVQFESMFDWIDNTINYFEQHPEWQLIIKPHPAEENKFIPVTQQTVIKYLNRRSKPIPFNVIVLGAKTEISVYDLFPFIHVGLVYTTTVGIEMACRGMPVLTAGNSHYRMHGFTFDTLTKEDYFICLEKLLNNYGQFSENSEWSKLANKFMYLYMFEYPIDIGVIQYDFVDADILVSDGSELLAGNFYGLDYVCDKILRKESIF